MPNRWTVSIVDAGGLGRIMWEGPAATWKEALHAVWPAAPAETMRDVNRDGSRWESDRDDDSSYVCVEAR